MPVVCFVNGVSGIRHPGHIRFFPGLLASEGLGRPFGVPAWGWGLAAKASFRFLTAGPSFSEALPSAVICISLAPPGLVAAQPPGALERPGTRGRRLGRALLPAPSLGGDGYSHALSRRPHTPHPGSGRLGSRRAFPWQPGEGEGRGARRRATRRPAPRPAAQAGLVIGRASISRDDRR